MRITIRLSYRQITCIQLDKTIITQMTNTICDLMMTEAVVSQRRCPSCGKTKILSDENTGELFCGSCGFVITEKLADTGAEWRSFSQDEGNRARTGAGTSLTMHDMGLSTVIGSVNKDATGKTHVVHSKGCTSSCS